MSLANEITLESSGSRRSFFNHVFSTTEEGKGEVLNVLQYSLLGVVPIVILNKTLQRLIPDADSDKSSLEILVEVLVQLIIMFVGIVIIHRIITYVPTYSEFKYESLSLTNVILAFLVVVLSLQTKLGIKVNILVDRVQELWSGSGPREHESKPNVRRQSNHIPSQGDHLGSSQSDIFPPAPMATTQANPTYDTMMRGNPSAPQMPSIMEPVAANAFGGFSNF
jgi:hypothetical protein